MKDNEQIRSTLNRILEENGIKLDFVVRKTGINVSSLSRWRHGDINFIQDKLNKLDQFCSNYN